MKGFIVGLIIGIVVFASQAEAIEIQLDKITATDFFCGCALAGILANPDNTIRLSNQEVVDKAVVIGVATAKKRGRQ